MKYTKEEIINIIKENTNALIEPHNEKFIVICQWVIVNDLCFRNIRQLKFVGNTLWLNEETSIGLEEITDFDIHEQRIIKKEENTE